ncbi:acyl-CoA dehydrogenase family protein [Mycobacterium sp. 1274756.6]|uniref:acyl-CoA dehydrogenase family protein n=1 Tax=Mycobacterium sp. 1274756.6 TaxID=1834076 RepID=UPI0008016D2F|nr:acyl-CoA dehydrogenase family protein [Mycobacterium sp. 1274756.6]OBJ68022.1 acyl-CoA dehydrogenase [Mycobacterium sp. 1274756.6]
MTVFSPEHEEFRASVRRFVDERINPNIDEWEAAGMMPLREIIGEMAKLGFVGLDYDPAYGGQGADHLFTLVLAEEMGRVDHGSFPMAFGVHNAMATPSLHKYGTDELKEQFLSPAIRGDAIAAVAITEPDAGSDVAALKTRARRDGNDWIINGAKIYITNALQADWLCVLARTSDEGGFKGMSQIIVPTSTPGFSVAKKLHKLGMRASDTGLLSFDDVRVPVSNTIGTIGRGFQQQMEQFVMERMWGCYSVPSGIEIALGRTRDYAKQRKVFGQPLSAQQYLAYTYAELAAETDLLKVYNRAIAQAFMDGENVTRMATVAKLKAGRLVRQVADWCLQVHGGVGYMEETWTARFFRDNRLLAIGGGADEVMMRVLSSMDGFA